MLSAVPLPSYHPRPDVLGRERETRELRALLARPDLACLTILGPGGVGKTRIATYLAAELAAEPGAPFADGIWFVPLASLTDPDRAPAVILDTLGLELATDPSAQAIIDALREREGLLILDNVEQVIEIGSLVAALAAECRDVKIVVTSRRPLRITGEQEYALSPLPLPAPKTGDPEALRANPAVQLFLRRATMVNPSLGIDDRALAAVAEICRGLDGLPLAIELAAARAKALSPAALAAQIGNRLRLLTGGPRDAPERQQTLRAAIGWSYDILAPWEQRRFRQLALFAGGFPLSLVESFAEIAAERGLDAGDADDALDTIGALVDHSLVRPTDDALDDPRWSMLETIRAYGQEQAAVAGLDAGYRAAHAEALARLADRAEEGMLGTGQAAWIRTLAAEEANVRAAVAWALDTGEKAVALRILGPLWRYFSVRHLGSDGRALLSAALALPGDVPPPVLGTALRGAGLLAEDISDHAASQRFHDQALATWKQVGDTRRIARSLDDLGNVAHDQGHYAEAEALHEEALAIARANGHARQAASALFNLGSTAYLRGDLATANRRWQEVLDGGTVDDPLSHTIALNNLGVVALHQGELPRARERLTAALAIYRELGMPPGAADALINLGDVEERSGNAALAREYIAAAAEVYRRLDDPKGLHNIAMGAGVREAAAGDISTAAASFNEGLREAGRADNLLGYADAIERITGLAPGGPDAAEAAALFGAARALRTGIGAEPLREQAEANAVTERALRSALGEAAYAAALAAGAAISPRQARTRAAALAEKLAAGAPASTPAAAPPPAAVGTSFGLTKRELEVLRLLAEGQTDRDMAAELFISPRTAGVHVGNILGKLAVDSRAAAVATAFRNGLL